MLKLIQKNLRFKRFALKKMSKYKGSIVAFILLFANVWCFSQNEIPTVTINLNKLDNSLTIDTVKYIRVNSLINFTVQGVDNFTDSIVFIYDFENVHDRDDNGYKSFLTNQLKAIVTSGKKSLSGDTYPCLYDTASISYLPIQIQNKDFTKLTIDIINKKTGEHNVRDYVFYNKKGFKLDYSLGLNASFLKDKKYVLTQSENDLYKITPSQNGKFLIGAAIFAHAYSRWHKGLNLSATTGLMIGAENKVHYLLGTSLIWGKEQRIIINIGVAAGVIKELSEQHDINKTYTEPFEINYKDIWKAALFFGVSYNF
ncbi:MAG TPA: hypothetical protein PKD18_14975 [Saprospiraceae bacterium]|nr:hypothetical protein [Saprospiraceae bacterium]